jgi:hypothetical protein
MLVKLTGIGIVLKKVVCVRLGCILLIINVWLKLHVSIRLLFGYKLITVVKLVQAQLLHTLMELARLVQLIDLILLEK